MNGKPTPAPATWPYPHRTVAEIDETHRLFEQRYPRIAHLVQPQTKRRVG